MGIFANSVHLTFDISYLSFLGIFPARRLKMAIFDVIASVFQGKWGAKETPVDEKIVDEVAEVTEKVAEMKVEETTPVKEEPEVAKIAEEPVATEKTEVVEEVAPVEATPATEEPVVEKVVEEVT